MDWGILVLGLGTGRGMLDGSFVVVVDVVVVATAVAAAGWMLREEEDESDDSQQWTGSGPQELACNVNQVC